MLTEKEISEQIGHLVIQLWIKAKELEAAKAALAAVKTGDSAVSKG